MKTMKRNEVVKEIAERLVENVKAEPTKARRAAERMYLRLSWEFRHAKSSQAVEMLIRAAVTVAALSYNMN
jgi:hypothetical protein